MQKASVPISKSQRPRKNCGHEKSPEKRGFLARHAGFEPAVSRLGVTPRRFCSVMHNVKKSEKSQCYGVFQ